MHNKSAIVVGAGIAGLSLTCLLEQAGFRVMVIEKDFRPTGASIRNFGMIWPIGQPGGMPYNIAKRSRELWITYARKAKISLQKIGSVHVAYHPWEWTVLQEIVDCFQQQGRRVHLLNAQQLLQRYPQLQPDGLMGGMWSEEECIVDPREAILQLIAYLEERPSVSFQWNQLVYAVDSGKVYTRQGMLTADLVFLATGADMRLLISPLAYSRSTIPCKLQMLRMQDKSHGQRLGVALCGGLSLVHYKSFQEAPSWQALHAYYLQEKPDYITHGIHVMVSPMPSGEYTVGDSHEYTDHPDPFEKTKIYSLILTELMSMIQADHWDVMETWHGVYLKMNDGSYYWQEEVLPGVYVYNGLGGAGMTLSFGLSERLIASI